MNRELRLDALRDEIDDVDDRIHDLLMRRAEIAGLVGASKRRQALNGTPQLFRPAREARVLRRLLARHRGPLPRRVVQDVWRSIIAGNLLLQGRMSVAVMPGASRAFARDHFGPFIDMHEESSPSGALAAVDGGKVSVAGAAVSGQRRPKFSVVAGPRPAPHALHRRTDPGSAIRLRTDRSAGRRAGSRSLGRGPDLATRAFSRYPGWSRRAPNCGHRRWRRCALPIGGS